MSSTNMTFTTDVRTSNIYMLDVDIVKYFFIMYLYTTLPKVRYRGVSISVYVI